MSDLLRDPSSAYSAATPDGEPLRRFAADRDEDAFELLVRRHADLVWKVCRGILRDDRPAAEDALQATFLALARHAGAVGRESVGGWLFRVARHAALKARRRRADDAADVGFQALEVGEKLTQLLREVSRNPALSDDDKKEVEKLIQEFQARKADREKK